ncbi:MAG: hypothetical protein AABW61_01675 [Candidatus Aenigmatarchaeota archaeon]
MIGLVVGLFGAGYVVGLLPIELPCLYKFLFFCIIGPHIIVAIIIAYIISKVFPI